MKSVSVCAHFVDMGTLLLHIPTLLSANDKQQQIAVMHEKCIFIHFDIVDEFVRFLIAAVT
ncbi:hypothetical protein [Paenibacillus sp. UNC451MF]|uniref:hypothetical protein n=1 Tax=Paenibacillus sp. UNC451MF TaxID=1449063 RepID=UPI00048D179D|nr:hypothetical protein [Paenibacillus sp. UNC451MF]